MKILIISHEYPPVGGGGASMCALLCAEMAAMGNSIHVITSGYDGTPSRENSYDGRLRITRVGPERKSADSSSFFEMYGFLKDAIRAADDVLQTENYDICLAFFGIPSGVAAFRLKRKYSLPYVIRSGGGDIPGFQKRFGLLYRLLGPKIKEIWQGAKAVIVNSTGLKQMAEQYGDGCTIKVINNGVDTELFNKQDDIITGDPIRLLCVARLIERKGIQDLIPELRKIEEASGRRVKLILVGDGPYREQLNKLAMESDNTEKIIFAGRKGRDELPDEYRQADIFVFPSFKEGMPNAVLEAMASGLPVVMRKSCQGSHELIRGNGIKAEGRFADSVIELLKKSDNELIEMGKTSAQLAKNDFSKQKMTAEYIRLFKDILEK